MIFFKFFPQTIYENIHKRNSNFTKLHKLTFKSKIQKKALIRTVSSLGHSIFYIKIVKSLSGSKLWFTGFHAAIQISQNSRIK